MPKTSTFAGLDAQDRESLVDVMETSLTVHTQAQFYLWAQGGLQRFLPHETVLCLSGDIARLRFDVDVISRAVGFAQDDTAGTWNNLLLRVVDDWLRSGRQPRLFPLTPEERPERRQLFVEFRRRGLGHVAAHGVREIQDGAGSFFVFLGVGEPPGPRCAYVLDMLMPHLHVALLRMRTHAVPGKGGAAAAASGTAALTRRQLQVLLWVKSGKTNEEIGQILDVSAPTVKNHVQRILRKLSVSNRAQAVGKAVTLGLFATGARSRAGDTPSDAAPSDAAPSDRTPTDKPPG